MITSITVRNVNDALVDAIWALKMVGVRTSSRNGDTLASPAPFITTYTRPKERVLFSALRDANPFFHLLESIWMLAGSAKVDFVATYAKQIREYSDDGVELNGAYGARWRRHFGNDQIMAVIHELRNNPDTRRAVIAMWDGAADLETARRGGKDVPCNTHLYFSTHREAGMLDMTVCCRSNDAVWGCYGANAVHFSMLQQLVAEELGLGVGHYVQFSNNLHLYVDRPDVQRLVEPRPTHPMERLGHVYVTSDNRYDAHGLIPSELLYSGECVEDFLSDAELAVDAANTLRGYCTRFFRNTIRPAMVAHELYRAGDFIGAASTAATIEAADWRVACVEWLQRRYSARTTTKGGAV